MEENSKLKSHLEESAAELQALKAQIDSTSQNLKIAKKDLETMQDQYDRAEFECTKLRVKLRQANVQGSVDDGQTLKPAAGPGSKKLKHANSDVGFAHVTDLL